jgi:hypothetical protein
MSIKYDGKEDKYVINNFDGLVEARNKNYYLLFVLKRVMVALNRVWSLKEHEKSIY